jgi:hypothetical protein
MDELTPQRGLDSLRQHWRSRPPAPSVDQAVLKQYRRTVVFRAKAIRFWAPMCAAVACGALLMAFFVHGGRDSRGQADPARPPAEARYVPVSQPKLIVVSMGEHP